MLHRDVKIQVDYKLPMNKHRNVSMVMNTTLCDDSGINLPIAP
jgi:hypothetical protein